MTVVLTSSRVFLQGVGGLGGLLHGGGLSVVVYISRVVAREECLRHLATSVNQLVLIGPSPPLLAIGAVCVCVGGWVCE